MNIVAFQKAQFDLGDTAVDRVQLWHHRVQSITNHPCVTVGPNSFVEKKKTSKANGNPHGCH